MNTQQVEQVADDLNETRVLLQDAVDLFDDKTNAEAKTNVAHALAFVEYLLEQCDDSVRDLYAAHAILGSWTTATAASREERAAA